ncbi:MAG: hypothetical protein ACP5LX_07050, partial [Nitrososphaeria archaeon]
QSPPSNQINYCQDCGQPIPFGMTYCTNCGSVKIGPYPPSSISRPAGVTILGIIQILFSLGDLVAGMILAGFFLTASGAPYVGGILADLGVLFIFAGALSLIFAIAFLTGRNWGRILMMIGAVIELFAFPIGTVIGIVILWYLTRPRVRAYFKQPKGKKYNRPYPQNP